MSFPLGFRLLLFGFRTLGSGPIASVFQAGAREFDSLRAYSQWPLGGGGIWFWEAIVACQRRLPRRSIEVSQIKESYFRSFPLHPPSPLWGAGNFVRPASSREKPC